MPSLWRNLRGRFDRSTNPRLGRWVSVLYGMGVWTMLGVLFLKWMQGAKKYQATHAGVTQEIFQELTEDERLELLKKKNLAIIKRQEELAVHVAENAYKPVDFMG